MIETVDLRTLPGVPTRAERMRHSRWTAPVAVGLFGAAFSAALSWVPSPWYDETATISAATRPLPQLLTMLGNVDAVHGVYYVVMHFWFAVVGYSPFTLRLPSALAIGLAAAVLVVLARRLVANRTAIAAGLVFCLLPRATWAGTEGRSYALGVLLAVVLTLLFLEASRRTNRRALVWVAYGLLAFAACSVFLYLALLVVAHGVSALLLRSGFRPWLIVSAAVGLAMLPLAIDEVRQSGQVGWIPPIGPGTVRNLVVGQVFYGNTVFAWVGWALALAGVGVIVFRGRGATRPLAVALPWLLVPTGGLLAASIIVTPLYSPRYATFTVPAVAILIAVALSALRRTRWTIIGLVLCVAITVPSYLHQRIPTAKQDSSWGQVAATIAGQRALEPVGQVDAVVYGPLRYHPKANTAMLALAYPAEFAGLVDLKAGEPAADRALLWAGRIPLSDTRSRLGSHAVVWLVTSDKRDWRPGVTAQLTDWGYHLDRQWHFDGMNVVRYLLDE